MIFGRYAGYIHIHSYWLSISYIVLFPSLVTFRAPLFPTPIITSAMILLDLGRFGLIQIIANFVRYACLVIFGIKAMIC